MNWSLLISVISLAVAITAAIFALLAFLQSKKDAFQSIAQVLLSSKNGFLMAYRAIINDDRLTIEQRDYLLQEHASNYCDAFEVASDLYLKKAINQKLFKNVFKDEIETICNGCGIADYIENPPSLFKGDIYKSICKVAEEWELKISDNKTQNYRIVTLCGSARFKDKFMEVQKRLTLEGDIVISVGLFSVDDEVWKNMEEDMLMKTKTMLGDMHKRKIDMADEIYVINVGGYIGECTRSEIEYAREQGKIIRYLEVS